MLGRDEVTRYSRNILLPEVRRAGQEKLKASHVVVVGAGGLGSPVLAYLAAAGVGRLTIIDSDNVDLTNLQRQVLFQTADVGHPKAERARDHILALNPEIDVTAKIMRLTPSSARAALGDADLILETSDNFPTKFLVNDAAFYLKKPLVTAGILRFEGQLMSVRPDESACYRCLFFAPPPAEAVPTCAQAGVLGATAGIIGSMQAADALKILTGAGTPLFGRLIVVDVLTWDIRRIAVPRNPACPLCGTGEVKAPWEAMEAVGALLACDDLGEPQRHNRPRSGT